MVPNSRQTVSAIQTTIQVLDQNWYFDPHVYMQHLNNGLVLTSQSFDFLLDTRCTCSALLFYIITVVSIGLFLSPFVYFCTMYYMSRTVRRVDSLGDSCQDVLLVYPIYEHGTGPHISLGGTKILLALSAQRCIFGQRYKRRTRFNFFRNLMC